jgi:cell division protein FtsB
VSINLSQLPRRLFLGLFLLGSLVLSLSLLQGIKELLAIENQVRQAEQTAKDLEREKESLKQQLAGVSSPDYQETEIRDNLLMARPNETVVILPDIDQALPEIPETQASDTSSSVGVLPIWRRWVEVFF